MSKQKPHLVELATHAVKSFQSLLSHDDGEVKDYTVLVLNSLGHAHMRLEQFNDAASAFRKSLEIQPEDNSAICFLDEIKDRFHSHSIQTDLNFKIA